MEMDSSSEDEDYILERNPLLIDVFIERLMDFLSLKNVKNCRLVCHKWNYFAGAVLKKRTKIVFTTSFRPSDFMAHCSQPNHQTQPFTAFSLTAGCCHFHHINSLRVQKYISPDKRWTLSEINEFVTNWGKHIKKLELSLMQVWMNRNDRNAICGLNIDNLFESLGSNLEDFVLVGHPEPEYVEVSLKKLSSVKTIYLDTCYIKLDSFENRITPLKFKLGDVKFRRNGKTVANTIINDLVDFSICSDIDIKMEQGFALCGAMVSKIKFDFSRDVVGSNKIEFQNIAPLNVKKLKTKMDRLSLCRCPTEPVQINLKELELKDCKIDLTLITGTIEKLNMLRCDVVSLDIHPLNLPNLKFLSLTPKWDGITVDTTLYKIVSLFVNCENLFDLELTRLPLHYDDDDYDYYYGDVETELDINCLPKSVKVLKLRNNQGLLKFAGTKNDPMEVDVLILADEDGGDGDSKNLSSMKKVLERIKPKVFIRGVFRHESFFRAEPKETVSQFITDIVQDKQLEKTILELKQGPHILKSLELVDQSKPCKNPADESPSVIHEFLGQFLVTEEQDKDFDGHLARVDIK